MHVIVIRKNHIIYPLNKGYSLTEILTEILTVDIFIDKIFGKIN